MPIEKIESKDLKKLNEIIETTNKLTQAVEKLYAINEEDGSS